MEPKEEPKKIDENKNIKDEINLKEETLDNTNENISKDIKAKNTNQFNKLELNKQHFQIIQQKSNLRENSVEKNETKERIDEHKALSDKNIINFKNKGNNDNIQMKFPEIKETAKKSRSQDQKETSNIYYKYNDNNQNVYSLLNSYYKDIDLNFKEKKANNPGKNFLLKNKLQEKTKQENIPYNPNNYNYSYNYPFIPYYYYQNPYMNNPNMYSSYNNPNSTYQHPENSFNINNQINYHLSNNINYYNYNFQRNKFKHRKNYATENNDHLLYIINIEKIIKGIENRTTVMIRHIPNRYSYQNLQDEINLVCQNKYDFLYLPLDSENNCNLGYAFINFINPLHIVNFYFAFKSRKWLCYNSLKECDLSFAKFQGKSELTSNFERNMNKSDDKRRIPLLFEIKNPPKIELPKKYYEMIKEYKPEFLKDINWI